MGFFDIFRKSVKKTKQSLSLSLDSFSGKITFDTLEEPGGDPHPGRCGCDHSGQDLLPAGRAHQAPEH